LSFGDVGTHMSTNANGLLIYMALVVTLSLIAHTYARRFWLTCGTLALVCSVINIGHEVVTHGFRIRPSDVALWLPMLFIYGAVVAFPIALLIGGPFAFARGRRKTA
jgi:hypothetical protein